MIEKEFEANINSLTQIQEFIEKWCIENCINEKIISKIAICTDEIVSNIVFYSGANFIRIKCNFENNISSVTFIDNGKMFNPLEDSLEPNINAPIEEKKIGGLGILLIKKLMNSVIYEWSSECNCLTISI